MKLIILFYFILLTQFLFAQSFTEVPPQPPFDGVSNGSIAFSDVDGDNDQDVLITGYDNSSTVIAKLYTNDGMGIFSEKTGTPFDGVEGGSIAFSDVDGDNDQDVLITGENFSNRPIAKLYTNDGMGNFTEKTGTPFDGVYSGSIVFSDVDGDNDQDVLITGENIAGTPIAKLYTNDGMGNFTEKAGTAFDGVYWSSIAFSDVDGDMDQDVLITGEHNPTTRIAKLYTNDGMGNFSEKSGTPFDGVRGGSIAFSDVDGDNDPDVLITGKNIAGTGISKLYLNDGMGIFSEKTGTPFDGIFFGSIAFSDVDGDNDPDVLITGEDNGSTGITKLYTNDGMGVFSERTGTSFDGVWGSSIAFLDVDGDKDEDVLITGFNFPNGKIAKLYANDGIGNFSLKASNLFEIVSQSSISFSDVDGDNDQDVLITGWGSSGIAKLYTNDGVGIFTEKAGTPFDGVSVSSIGFSDVDGDNDEDVLITGSVGSFSGSSKLYLNDGLGNFFEKTGTPFVEVYYSSIAFADVDGDNDQDVLVTGSDNSFTRIAKLYTNDGLGNFIEKTGAPFDGVDQGSIAFSDVDGDNDPDVLITGINTAGTGNAKLYTNDGMGNFTEKPGTPFDGVYSSSIAFADVDGDNDQDVLITGSRIAKLYTNDGMGNFIEKTGTPFDGVEDGSIAFSDVDGDKDPDVLITGENSAFAKIAKLYTNDGMGNFTEVTGTPFEGVYGSSIAFSDVDGDTDADVLITGSNGSTGITKLYTNDRIGTSIDETGLAQDNNILLYPNPSKNREVYIDYLSEKNNVLEISLMDIEGSICFQQYSPVTHGLNTITVSYPALPGGWYIIRLDDGIRSRYGKLVVE